MALGMMESVAESNFKLMAESAVQDFSAHRARLQILAEKSLGNTLERMDMLNVEEGLGISAAQRGDLSKQISDLAAAVASMQISIKGGQTTPPVTP